MEMSPSQGFAGSTGEANPQARLQYWCLSGNFITYLFGDKYDEPGHSFAGYGNSGCGREVTMVAAIVSQVHCKIECLLPCLLVHVS